MKRSVACIFALLLLFSMLASAAAPTPAPQPYVEQIQTIYQDSYRPENRIRLHVTSDPYQLALEEAAADLREGMLAREAEITVELLITTEDYEAAWYDVWDLALSHTGQSKEGDYLYWQWRFCSGGIGTSWTEEGTLLQLTYILGYDTDLTQEQELDAAVDALLAELDLDGCSDYEKVCAIYDYMCDNITYDYANLEDTEYYLKHTAYAALMHKTAVCEGYALLFYRLALAVGVDNRIIVSENHAWNIVKLGDLYYNLDATWDASWRQAGLEYNFFLRGSENFQDHVATEEYLTAAFMAEYPISVTDYVPETTGLTGDLDLNGEVDAEDLTILARHVAQIDRLTDATALENADVNGDGQIDADDLTIHAQYVAHIISDWEAA